jgi:hypothetical protein
LFISQEQIVICEKDILLGNVVDGKQNCMWIASDWFTVQEFGFKIPSCDKYVHCNTKF